MLAIRTIYCYPKKNNSQTQQNLLPLPASCFQLPVSSLWPGMISSPIPDHLWASHIILMVGRSWWNPRVRLSTCKITHESHSGKPFMITCWLFIVGKLRLERESKIKIICKDTTWNDQHLTFWCILSQVCSFVFCVYNYPHVHIYLQAIL